MADKPSFASEHRKDHAELVRHLNPILHEQETQEALEILRHDFSDRDGVGPRRVAEFMYRSPSDEMQADVAGFVRELLRKCNIA